MNEWIKNHCVKGCLNVFYNVFTIHSHYHGNKHVGIHNTFVIVAWDIGFHVGHEHNFICVPSTIFNSSYQQRVNILHQRWNSHSHPNWCGSQPNTCEFISLIFEQFKDLLSNQRMELSQPTLTYQFLLVPIL